MADNHPRARDDSEHPQRRHRAASKGQGRRDSRRERNEAAVCETFDKLLDRWDYAAAQRFWSPYYVQYSAHIEPGRESLFGLVKASPPDMQHENALIVSNSEYVMLHGRITNVGQPANWIVTGTVRTEDGLLAGHWDVIEDEFLSRPRIRDPRTPRAAHRAAGRSRNDAP
jgi:predicted SnoaL-like aldol condensation-catalyzing enzyme